MPALALVATLSAAPSASADSFGGVSPPINGGIQSSGGAVVGGSKSHPTVSGTRAVLKNGLAYAPSQAPAEVKAVIWAANQIRHKPYKWGGGHGSWKDTGYDCSGSVSYALHGGGLLSYPLDSRGFMRYGEGGGGAWVSIYANNGHAYAVIAGLRFDTSDITDGDR